MTTTRLDSGVLGRRLSITCLRAMPSLMDQEMSLAASWCDFYKHVHVEDVYHYKSCMYTSIFLF